MIWLALDLEPFTMVNNKGLRYFFAKNFPKLQIPDESTLRKNYLQDVYEMVFDKVRSDLEDVSTINLMFDGWTDRHHAMHYTGLRVQFIRDDWSGAVVTLSVKPCAGDADSITEHIINEITRFIPNYRDKLLFSTHDGASTMIKVSSLLKVRNWNHCVAHALHLLLTTDAMKKVGNVMSLLQKCKGIVNSLHFKTEILEREVCNTNDRKAAAELLDKISRVKELQDADDQLEIDETNDEDMYEPCSAAAGSENKHGMDFTAHKKVHRLQNEVPTRWNSSLQMIQSLLHMKNEVSNALKLVGHYDKCFKSHEWTVLEELSTFLKSFNSLTELVSTHITSLSLIPLIRAEITDSCKSNVKDCDEVKTLKQLIMKNIDKRLPMTNATILATLMDPSTKVLLQMMDTQKEQLLYDTAVSDFELARGGRDAPGTENEQVDAVEESAVDASTSEPVSKKQKLLKKHTPSTGFLPNDKLREEVRNYIAYKPAEDEDDPLEFWKKGSFPLLGKVAKAALTQSASSVPVENMFSTMGLILNGKRSSLAPHRANWLSFIHDNYSVYYLTG